LSATVDGAWTPALNSPEKRDSAIESLAKSQVLRVLVSEPARIFYIVKRGLTWGFSSRNATQVSL